GCGGAGARRGGRARRDIGHGQHRGRRNMVRPGHRDGPDDEQPRAEQCPADGGDEAKPGQREERGTPPRANPRRVRRPGLGHGRAVPDAAAPDAASSSRISGPSLVTSPAPMVSTRSPGTATDATTPGTSPNDSTYLAA